MRDKARCGRLRDVDGGAPRHVILLGLMGAGKTTVGAALAARLGVPLRDSDADLLAATGQTARELHDSRGVDALHALESEHLLRSMATPDGAVICAAAAVADDPVCVAELTATHDLVVWLGVPPNVLAARFALEPHRPAYGPDTAAFLTAQAARREPIYLALADLVVASGVGGPGGSGGSGEAVDAVEAIVSALAA
jgi:shikimate kinase